MDSAKLATFFCLAVTAKDCCEHTVLEQAEQYQKINGVSHYFPNGFQILFLSSSFLGNI